ncbi:hypothetical protein [Neotamlana laminarinivorans]|uniref:Uncharacterized protein n=1 Tax=Neotamlana laminarinivorans TaxID=2883124 RepID=A0A9X1I0I2_9FLAO|nr:hypothetical protein [Tamlana laminarinivorans]MCB4798695.1 hypothetical protein [Tamlana laminarinivorans]
MNWKDTRDWIYKNLFWILIIVSILILWLSSSITNVWWNSILEKAGIAILSSGVFASVLKSIQFTGIFKDEVSKVMLETDFIKNRRDLPELWSKISKIIYDRKFKKISKDLEQIILDNYFPTNSKYYYKDYFVTINIEKIDKDFNIFYTQTCTYDVIVAKNEDDITLTLETTITQQDDVESSSIINELEYFKVNGNEQKTKEDPETVDDKNFSRYFMDIKGKGPHKVESKYKRRYSLKNENYKLFRLNHFTKNMDVAISYPKNVCVSFFNIGLIKKFEHVHVEFENQIHRKHRKSLIFPKQGFGMSFEKK